jgi:hypothetical protein
VEAWAVELGAWVVKLELVLHTLGHGLWNLVPEQCERYNRVFPSYDANNNRVFPSYVSMCFSYISIYFCMVFNVFLLVFMDFHVFPCISMYFHDFPYIFHAFQWISMCFHALSLIFHAFPCISYAFHHFMEFRIVVCTTRFGGQTPCKSVISGISLSLLPFNESGAPSGAKMHAFCAKMGLMKVEPLLGPKIVK